MKKCWNLQPEGRPDFKIIVKELESAFKTVVRRLLLRNAEVK